MIHEVEIKNFQSLKDITLTLSPFTVIVGRSSSGKSALTRALRTLTSNRRGNAFITHGERLTTITAHTDKGTVSLTRGKAAQDNSYTVIPTEPTDINPQRTFTKLGGETPEEVSRFLGIAAKDPINYAGQFDKPYLLDESSGEVARVLGALTNVSVIFDGARESNRRKLSHSQTLKTRSADLEQIKEKIPQYQALQQQDEALAAAERTIATAQGLQQQIAKLSAAVEIADLAQSQIAKLTPIATQPDISDEAAVAALTALKAFTTALQTQSSTKAAHTAAQERYEAAEAHLTQTEERYAAAITEITGSLEEWILATARTWTMTDSTETGDWTQQQQVLTVEEAARVFTKYMEERTV